MTSANLRRRLHRNEHLDTSSSHDNLTKPLLSTTDGEDDLDEERRKERIHWTFLFSNLIAQWAQWLVRKMFDRLQSHFRATCRWMADCCKLHDQTSNLIFAANIVFGSGSLLGRLLPNSQNESKKILPPALSPLQEERLKALQKRLGVPFDGSRIEHRDALKQLWKLAFPLREMPALKSELWKEMGWQGSDPSTDFRGGGYISLENLIFFAKKYPEAFQRLLHKQDGNRAEWEYPFAVAGINISFMLAQMLDLQSGCPNSLAGVRFLELLREDEMAFDNLYCVAFQMMDAQWLAKRASYMEFNDVLKSTRMQLERELSLEDVFIVRDLPAFNMLRR